MLRSVDIVIDFRDNISGPAWSLKTGPIGPVTPMTYQTTLRNIPEERSQADSRFFRNICNDLPDHTSSNSRRLYSLLL
jgi:hypothetical protein